MARADRQTLLSLDEWFRIMGINPLHANQINLPEIQNDFCGDLWFQHGWQQGSQISREDLGEAIAQAEHRIQEYVGYSLAPDWVVDERRPTIRPTRPELINLGTSDVRWYNQVVIGDAKKWIAGGRRAVELISASHAVVYSHQSGTPPDNYPEVAFVGTTGIPLTIPECELKLFYPGMNGAPEWEIRPLTAIKHEVFGPTTVTEFTFPRHLAVSDALQEQLVPAVVDGTDNANFLATVDIYRVFNDPQAPAELLWEPLPACACPTGSTVTCHVCEYAFQTGCLIARGDPDNTILAYHPAEWIPEDAGPPVVPAHFNPTKLVVGRQPDLVRLFYYAGHQDKSVECPTSTMDPYWANVVAHFAAAILRKIPCDCSKLDFEHWQQDLAFVGGVGEASIFQLAPGELSNPFGTRRGAVEAWRAVNSPNVQLLRTSVSV